MKGNDIPKTPGIKRQDPGKSLKGTHGPSTKNTATAPGHK